MATVSITAVGRVGPEPDRDPRVLLTLHLPIALRCGADVLKALTRHYPKSIVIQKHGIVEVWDRMPLRPVGEHERGGTVTIEELRRLREAGTPGPWQTDGPSRWRVLEGPKYVEDDWGEMALSPDDAALIVAAVNALPALLDVAEAAQAWLAGYDAAEWNQDDALFAIEALRAAIEKLTAS